VEEQLIAVSHPGKIGDALYALPTVRYLCSRHNCKADFYTSGYCVPLVRLLEHQPFIRKVVIPEGYAIENAFQGIQPWKMPIPQSEYSAIYQLGYREAPDKALPDYIAETVGAPRGLPVMYEYPEAKVLSDPYIVIAPGRDERFRRTLIEFVQRCPVKCVIIGAPGEYIGAGIDITRLDLLDCIPWIAHSEGFIGMMSAPLAIANGFPVMKVALDDGNTWNMRHVLRGPLNSYLIFPTAEQLLIQLGLISYSKCLHPKDYTWVGEAQIIPEMLRKVNGCPIRFEHEHRCWEYGIVLKALRDVGAQRVLDVGGGASVFAPAAAWYGMDVLQVDPSPCEDWVSAQAKALGLKMSYRAIDFFQFESNEKFDAVTCLSVLEHVERDQEFFRRLLGYVGKNGLICVTTDFHPSAERMTEAHLRTYNSDQLQTLIAIARAEGFEYFGPKPSYLWSGAQVNDYDFASLVMQRVQ